MTKAPTQRPTTEKTPEPEDEGAIIERMDDALKRMMQKPPETHEQMVKRRRKKATKKRA